MEVEADWRPVYCGRSPGEQDNRMVSTSLWKSQIWWWCARASSPRAISRRMSGYVRVEKQYCFQRSRSQFSQISVRTALSPDRTSGESVSHRESGARRILSSACSTALSRWSRKRRLPRFSSVEGDIHFFESIQVPDDKLICHRAGWRVRPFGPAAKYKAGKED